MIALMVVLVAGSTLGQSKADAGVAQRRPAKPAKPMPDRLTNAEMAELEMLEAREKKDSLDDYPVIADEDLSPATDGVAPKTMFLRVGMSERAVVTLLGYPSKVSMRTCGPDTKQSWACKVWDYDPSRKLMLYFAESAKGGWILNHWTDY